MLGPRIRRRVLCLAGSPLLRLRIRFYFILFLFLFLFVIFLSLFLLLPDSLVAVSCVFAGRTFSAEVKDTREGVGILLRV